MEMLNILHTLIASPALLPFDAWTLPVVLSFLLMGALVATLYFAKRAGQVKYRFITVGSHKLRTPLSKVKGATAELINKKEAADARGEPYTVDDLDERMLKQVMIEANRLVGLVNLLLEVSESEYGHAQYNKTIFNLVELVQEILRGYQNSQWRNDRAFIEFESNGPSIEIHADRARLASVIQVLLENAITYSPSGGRILVKVIREKRRVVFAITDSGIGILPNEKKFIFSKFYRSDRALKIDTEGTGVGLFLARHIVRGHSGRMWFESGGERQGSTFYFSLPVA